MEEARTSKVKSEVPYADVEAMLWRWIPGMPGSFVRRAQLIQLKIKKLEFLAWACIALHAEERACDQKQGWAGAKNTDFSFNILAVGSC